MSANTVVANAIRVARNITKSVLATEKMEGAGARVHRSIGIRALRNLDPFLLLDEFDARGPSGFPDHPHRGFETVTYMLEGEVFHEDSKGHQGHLGPGDLQWMSAAKGIVHAEMIPRGSHTRGLQLWVNLAKKDKFSEPNYQELPAEKVVEVVPEEGICIKVIAGESYGSKSPVLTRTPTMFIDAKLKKGKVLEQVIPKSYNGFIYTLAGTGLFGGDKHHSEPRHTLVLSENGGTTVPVESLSDDCHFVIVAGEPIREPIMQQGLFVMNTVQEIQQAYSDYQQGRNGFEGAPQWTSTIKNKWM